MSLPVFHLTPICSPFWRDVHDEALMELLDCHFRKGSRGLPALRCRSHSSTEPVGHSWPLQLR